MTISNSDSDNLAILSRLLFSKPENAHLGLSRAQFGGLLSLANTHHVVIRSLESLRGIVPRDSDPNVGDLNVHEWATNAIEQERARIDRAMTFLQQICTTLVAEGCEVSVIKSLDHWPDFGSDLDLFSSAQPDHVIQVMTHRLGARIDARSWGDRLANKWNFIVPGLPELVEIHIGRLGQTGELGMFASSLIPRSRLIRIGSNLFRAPAAVDRLMICTLQRMYRHFYIRLCDVADTMELLETEAIDYDDLQNSAESSGIWEGVATFLTIVSDYVARWRGRGRKIDLPASIRSAAQFGGEEITFANGFLRVPILPYSVRLYASEWASLALRGEIRSTARLSLLPWLATAAAVGMKITGSDKGIW